MMHHKLIWVAGVSLLVLGCGDGSTEADRIGVGAQCTASAECESPDEAFELKCLTQFKGGYCGLEGCTGDGDCPEGSACFTYDGDGNNYCFRICQDKPDCNRNREEANWANCVANLKFEDQEKEGKVCVPPSSGIEP